MTPTNSLSTQPINTSALKKFMLIGGAIGLALISLFVFGVKTNPAWGQLWRIRPLIITPLAGAAGGAVFYFFSNINLQGYKKVLAIAVGLIAFLVTLWIGVILGLDGTLWD